MSHRVIQKIQMLVKERYYVRLKKDKVEFGGNIFI